MKVHANDRDDEQFLLDSSTRTYVQLTNVTISPVQVQTTESTSPPGHLQSATTFSTSSPMASTGLTPPTIAKAIFSKFLNEQPSQSSPSATTHSRVRKQRKFGEVVTTDIFLNEIKEKARKKKPKQKTGQINIVQNQVPTRKSNRVRKKTRK